MFKKVMLPFASLIATMPLSSFGYQLCPANDDINQLSPQISTQLPCGLPGKMDKELYLSDFNGYSTHKLSHDVWLASSMLNKPNGRLKLVLTSAMNDTMDIQYFDCDLKKKRPTAHTKTIILKAGETKAVNIVSTCTAKRASQMWKNLDKKSQKYWVNFSRSVTFNFVGSITKQQDFTGHNISIAENKS